MATTKKAAKKPSPSKKARPKNLSKRPRTKTASAKKSLARALVAESTALDTLYIVDGSENDVTLEVNVGEAGQTSDMTIRLDNEVITENHAGDFPQQPLGTNQQLNGQKLSIVATIADTSRTTNFTSLTIRLTGGVAQNDFPLFKTVDSEGESADYLCLIEFFKP